MKLSVIILLIISINISCSKNKSISEANTNSSKNKISEVEKQKKSNLTKKISNPLNLEYIFLEEFKLEDGERANGFVEKGKNHKESKTGDYIWTKTIPINKSHKAKYGYEYQMDFTHSDVIATKNWLNEVMGSKYKRGSFDNPNWYNKDMTLIEIYEYSKKHNKNIILGFYSKSKNLLTQMIIDSGSKKLNTTAEIALVFSVLK